MIYRTGQENAPRASKCPCMILLKGRILCVVLCTYITYSIRPAVAALLMTAGPARAEAPGLLAALGNCAGPQ